MGVLLSFVIPCYRSEKTIRKVTEEIIETVSQRDGYDYEIICVNDCSPDHVYDVLQRLAEENRKIKVVNLVKNVGKHSAVLAGYAFAKGEYIVNLDDDYQCPIYELWRLLEPVETDQCDVATARYYRKKQALWKNLGSAFNARISAVMLEIPQEMRFENFSVMKRFVLEEIIKYKNPFPYVSGLIFRVTRRITAVDMEERERGDRNGSGFTFWRSVALFSNGLTAFSVKPLRISTIVGFLTSLFGFLYGIILIIRKLTNSVAVLGYTSMVVIQLFLGGLILMSLGMLGEYVGRIYICLNSPPQYIVRNTINLSNS